MSRGGKRKAHRESTGVSGVKTRRQKKILADTNNKGKLADAKNKESRDTTEGGTQTAEIMAAPTAEQLVGLIYSFDNKKETNINYFLLQFDNLIEQTNYGPSHKLTILKAKITGPARDRLMQDESVFLETDLKKFKEKLKELFAIKCNFSSAQNLFFGLKQNPNQSISDFIAEFNAAANIYIKKSGQDTAEQNNTKFLDQMKLARFLDAIRADIGLEIRKNMPENFAEACKVALKLEEAYSQTNIQEINAIATSKETEILNKLDKLSSESADQIRTLVTEINNLKLRVKDRNEKDNKYCEFCKRDTHDTQNCWFKDSHKNEKSEYRGNSYSPNRGFQNTQNRPYRHNYRQQQAFQTKGYQGSPRDNDLYNYDFNYTTPQFYAPPPPIYTQHPQTYYYNTGIQGYTQYPRGRGRGGYHNNVKNNQRENYEENDNTKVSNRDTKTRGNFKRGSRNNRRGQDKRHDPEN